MNDKYLKDFGIAKKFIARFSTEKCRQERHSLYEMSIDTDIGDRNHNKFIDF